MQVRYIIAHFPYIACISVREGADSAFASPERPRPARSPSVSLIARARVCVLAKLASLSRKVQVLSDVQHLVAVLVQTLRLATS